MFSPAVIVSQRVLWCADVSLRQLDESKHIASLLKVASRTPKSAETPSATDSVRLLFSVLPSISGKAEEGLVLLMQSATVQLLTELQVTSVDLVYELPAER